MYEFSAPIVTGVCVAAALMLLEHLFARRFDFRVRYTLGMLAFLAGFGAWAWRTGQWGAWVAAAAIAGSGLIVIVAYFFRWAWSREIGAVREAGRIEGRTLEANRGTTGIARDRRDR